MHVASVCAKRVSLFLPQHTSEVFSWMEMGLSYKMSLKVYATVLLSQFWHLEHGLPRNFAVYGEDFVMSHVRLC